MKFIYQALFILLLAACATNSSRRPVYKTQVKLIGGTFQDKQWQDELIFSRTSWFKDATMSHEVLLSKIDMNSPFKSWFGSEQNYLKKSSIFYIALVYSDINAKHNNAFVINQLESNGLGAVSILDFSHQIKAHQNTQDWNLSKHKVIGLCHKNVVESTIKVDIPGFKSQVLK